MSFQDLSISVLKVGRQLTIYFVVAAFFLIFTTTEGCIKEEAPVTPTREGNLATRTLAYGQNYRQQLYYSLEKDSVIASNLKWDWDLAFDASTEGSQVYVNAAKFMFAWQTPSTDMNAVRDTQGFAKNRRWEATNTPDTVTIGATAKNRQVFWIDRGYDINGDQPDMVKVQFEVVDDKKYRFKIASRSRPTDIKTYEVPKDPTRNLVHFSLDKNKVLSLEPPKKEWDLLFTQYMHTFFDPYTPYIVTGVLTNPNQVQVAVDSTMSFTKIDRTTAQNLKFTTKRDAIGYTWKEFTFADTGYKINSNYNYIIRTANDYFYKMRFVGFFDNQGRRGNPKFEFQRL
jgi:HmuY protein